VTLQAGQMLSHYRLVEKIGEGGMGVVWKATDTTLDREVALKVLPETFATDPERLSRFQREAKLLGSLSHPHIATLYGLEEADGVHFLVMELVDGETLADRLMRGPLLVSEALDSFSQVAEALEAAHGRGIIHRDLKPANIKITPDENAKVLDFGLAKALLPETEPLESGEDLSRSPTITSTGTRQGVILGTSAYMSPEQARGKPVDKRTDIWSFGCTLFEALSGRKPFGGGTVTDTLAQVLEREPDWDVLPRGVPDPIRRLLRRCLQKAPAQRLHDIADARILLREVQAGGVDEPERPIRRPLLLPLLGVAVITSILAAGAFWMWMPPTSPSVTGPVVRFVVDLPEGVGLGLEGRAPAISPDGRRIVYAGESGTRSLLYLRRIDEIVSLELPGTLGVAFMAPFFSPDGQWVAFAAEGKLKKIFVDGGAPIGLTDCGAGAGGSWGPDGTIVYVPEWHSGLYSVPSAGGAPRPVTDLEPGEFGHWDPQILPDGDHVLFTVWKTELADASIAVASLDTGQRKILVKGGSYARYAGTGHLVYAHSGSLLAAPFDLGRLEITGPALPVVDDIPHSIYDGRSSSSFSENGTLVYLPGGSWSARRTLSWVSRDGTREPLGVQPRSYDSLSLSPDGATLALTIFDRGQDQVHLLDLATGALSQLTFEHSNWFPIWSPGGDNLSFTSPRGGPFAVYSVPADRSRPEEILLQGESDQFASSWSPDGRHLLLHMNTATGHDIAVFDKEDGTTRVVVQTRSDEDQGQFSPDGRWLAYRSNISGRFQVYVQSFPGPGSVRQVSTEGGANPLWSPAGDELFYLGNESLMAVSVDSSGHRLELGRPHPLFDIEDIRAPEQAVATYAYEPRSQRFLVIQKGEGEVWQTRFMVVLNWFEELERLVPTDGN